MWSTTLGRRVEGPELDAEYWAQNLRAPVQFGPAIGSLANEGVVDFVEVSPHPVLTKAVTECLAERCSAAFVQPSLVRGESESHALCDAATRLIERGHGLHRVQAARLIPVSANTVRSLPEQARQLIRTLDTETVLDDVAYTASCRRTHHPVRQAVIARSTDELKQKLSVVANTDELGSAVSSDPKVAFVFAGQGSQWNGMGRRLYQAAPAFRAQLRAADRAVSRYAGWSVIEKLHADAPLTHEILQPTLFAVQCAFAALFRSWGIEPAIVVGHSMGEIAAACVAGALDLDDAAQLIVRRSKLMREHVGGRGAMFAVDLSIEEAREAVAGFDRLAVAVHNGPKSCVLSGDAQAMRTVIDRLEARDVFCRQVKSEYAGHSPLVTDLEPKLAAELEWLRPRAGTIPLWSTVTGGITDGHDLDNAYWVRNVRQMVCFHEALVELAASGHRVFLEVGPHPVLSSAIREGLPVAEALEVFCTSRRDDDEVVSALTALGGLYRAGCEPRWQSLFPGGGESSLCPDPCGPPSASGLRSRTPRRLRASATTRVSCSPRVCAFAIPLRWRVTSGTSMSVPTGARTSSTIAFATAWSCPQARM
jgi:acyl transferase domain-containing protein